MARPRSPRLHQKVLRVALDLFGERGIEATSMDTVAQTSGVSKATLYNHWADKEALLMEVMLWVNGLSGEPEDFDSGDLCSDLAAVLNRCPPKEFASARDRMMPALIAYSAVHQEFGDAWRHHVIEPPRRSLRRILRLGVERGLLPAALDIEQAMALLLGPGLYMHIFHKGTAPRTVEIGTAAAQSFWLAHALGPAAPAKDAKRRPVRTLPDGGHSRKEDRRARPRNHHFD